MGELCNPYNWQRINIQNIYFKTPKTHKEKNPMEQSQRHNQAFPDVESGMMNKNIKRYLISSVIKEIQNNITRR